MANNWFDEKMHSAREIIDNYNSFIESASSLNIFVRSTSIQKKKISQVDEYVKCIKYFKSQAISNGDEKFANLLFHFQCMLRSLQSSLKMWVHLKGGDYQKAWSSLVDAQEYIGYALKVEDQDGVRRMEDFLSEIRNTIFPRWTHYNSAAFSSTIGRCSICGEDFGACEHIEGLLYCGRICRRVGVVILKNYHSALVSNPRDRRCIVTEISNDDGRMMDVFTLECTDEVREKNSGVAGHMKGIILTTIGLDLD